MNKIILFFACYCVSVSLLAACPQGDNLYQRSVKASIPFYQNCAVFDNDEEAQVRLGGIYKTGEKNAPKDEIKALLFYHMAADNGNAFAQTELAKMLISMDQNPDQRPKLISYMNQIKSALKGGEEYSFKGEILHPYVLLLLASESADQKWYYPTTKKYSSEAVMLLKRYQLSEEAKKEWLRIASSWKQRKMMETAKEVLSEAEYQTFEKTIFPKQGRADPFLRKQVINNLKEKVDSYLNK